MTDPTDTSDSTADASPTPFHDLDAYVAIGRAAGLALSPDGSRLVTSVSSLDSEKTGYVTAVWEIDPAGERPARRLTRSAKGEASAAFLPDGSLLFASARPDPLSPGNDADDDVPLLWLLPAGPGEARVVGKRPGGVGGIVVARDAGTVLLASDTLPSSDDAKADEDRRKERKDKKVSAILHERYPVRYWDHDLGPDAPRLFSGEVTDDERAAELRDLTHDAGRALDNAEYDISADGTTIVTTWNMLHRGGYRPGLAVIDVVSAARRMLVDDPSAEFHCPRISPDGTRVVAIRERLSTPTEPIDLTLVTVSVADGTVREVTTTWDRWPDAPRWTSDGSALVVVADDDGRAPLFRIDADTGAVVRLTADDAAYSDPVVSPDGRYVYALRSSCLAPPAPVRLEAATPEQQPVMLPAPETEPPLPGTLAEVETAAPDGVRVRGWLAVPAGADAEQPAPLLLWVHGGPLGSWNAWSWRWNPWLAVARGYAVLLPDPALSTGYGRDFIRRGWGAWGSAPFSDLMAITDAVVKREDVDDERTAAMGGSFGGYMANWIAGHSDRFRAIVSHAGLWSLDQFGPTTDAAWYWEREMTPEMTSVNSPSLHADAITTPTLVIHGDKDYRLPIGEALRFWRDLAARSAADDGEVPHKFLYFPDEHHWILTPQHVKVWYQTVFAFLAHHVHGEDWQAPAILR